MPDQETERYAPLPGRLVRGEKIMSNYVRLIIPVPLIDDQIKASKFLMTMAGLCTCGRLLHATDAKFILGNIGPSDSPDPKRRNVLLMAAYCYDCFSRINASMKSCKAAAYKQNRSDAELRG